MSMRRTQGFTLIEVLVAMSVFAVMTILAYMSLGQTLANADMLGERMDRLQAIQRTMRYLSNDLSAASPRPVRSELGDTYMPAVMVSAANDFVLAVTHGGWSNPASIYWKTANCFGCTTTSWIRPIPTTRFQQRFWIA